jgi:hypothetical protein
MSGEKKTRRGMPQELHRSVQVVGTCNKADRVANKIISETLANEKTSVL